MKQLCFLLPSRSCNIILLFNLYTQFCCMYHSFYISFYKFSFLWTALIVNMEIQSKLFCLQPCRIHVLRFLCCPCLQTSGSIRYVSSLEVAWECHDGKSSFCLGFPGILSFLVLVKTYLNTFSLRIYFLPCLQLSDVSL